MCEGGVLKNLSFFIYGGFMDILITGGAGFIGSNLALHLQKMADNITIVDDFSKGVYKNLEGFEGDVVVADISKENMDWEHYLDFEPDYIFHEASNTDTTYPDDKEMLRSNIEGFRNVLEFAINSQAKVIYASSAGVYGKGTIPMSENSQREPKNAYAFSKYILENMAKKYVENYDLECVGLRYFNVYGPRESFKGKASSMIYQLALQMRELKRPRIFEFGEQFRDQIYIKDLVEANIRAMEAPSGVYNVGTGKPTSFNKIVEVLNKVLGTNLEPDYIKNPYTQFYQDQTLADVSLAASKMGFVAKYDIEAGIEDYIRWLGFA